MAEEVYWGTGRRKTAIARVRLIQGGGKIIINQRPVVNYFSGYKNLENLLKQPLVLTKLTDKFDTFVNVSGGGVSGQAAAIRHGISRALVKADEKLSASLRKAGFLTRDSRMVERKKPGQKKARKKFQFSKR